MNRTRYHRGFTLIEMLVAMVILSLSLGILYQAAGGATRNVRIDERYTYAVQIAQSLLADNSQVPPGGVGGSGESGDFRWRLDSELLPDDSATGIELYRLEAVVTWGEPGGRELVLNTIVPVVDDGGGQQ